MALPWIGDRIQAGGATIPLQITPNAALALTGVMRACSLLSDAASNAPPAIFRREDRGGRTVVRGSAASRALATLAHDDAECFAFGCALSGNGYLEIRRDQTGAPYSLRGLPPWRVSVEVDESARVFYRIAPDASIGEREERMVAAADVVHARFRAIGGNTLVGVPPVQACSPAFALALQSREVLRALFTNLAVPGGVLITPNKIDPVLARKLQSEFSQNYGAGGQGRVAVLANGLEYKSIVFNAADAQLLEQINATTADIARAYGVSKVYLEDDQHLTYATASESARNLLSLGLRPFLARCADSIAQKLLSRNERANGMTVEYDVSSFLVMPGKEMSDFLGGLVGSGLATPNELRNGYLGLPDVPEGDKLRGAAASAPAAAPAPKAAPDDALERRQLVAYRHALERWHAELQTRLRRIDDAAPRVLAGLVEHNATLRPTLPSLADVTALLAHEERAHVEAQLDEPEVIDQ